MLPRFPETAEKEMPDLKLWVYTCPTDLYGAFQSRLSLLEQLLNTLKSWDFKESEYPTIFVIAEVSGTYELNLSVGLAAKCIEKYSERFSEATGLHSLSLDSGLYAATRVFPIGQLVHAHEAFYADWIIKKKQVYDEKRLSFELLNDYFLNKSGFDLYVPIIKTE